jgi:hypothetical protein
MLPRAFTFFPIATGEALTKSNNPLASARVAGVLPGRLYSLSKEVIVRGGGKIIGANKVVVSLPKPFHSLDCGNALDGAFIRIGGTGTLLFLALASAHVKECVARVERSTSGGILLRNIGGMRVVTSMQETKPYIGSRSNSV